MDIRLFLSFVMTSSRTALRGTIPPGTTTCKPCKSDKQFRYIRTAFLPPVLPCRSHLSLQTFLSRRTVHAVVVPKLAVRRVRNYVHASEGTGSGRESEAGVGDRNGASASVLKSEDDNSDTPNTVTVEREGGVKSILSRCISTGVIVASMFAVMCGLPTIAIAREKKSVLTMTDRVSSFTLPSQEAALERERMEEERSQSQGILVKCRKIAITILPPVGSVLVVVWVASRLMKRAQNRQIREFQQQLEAFSNNLNIPNLDFEPTDKDAEQSAKSRAPSPQTVTPPQAESESDAGDNVQLEIFRKAGGDKAQTGSGGREDSVTTGDAASSSGAGATGATVEVESDPGLTDTERSWEKMIIECMSLCAEIRAKKSENYEQVVNLLRDSENKTHLNDPVYRVLTTRTVSRVLSSKIDGVISAFVENTESRISGAIVQLSHALEGARIIGNNVDMTGSLRYIGGTTQSKVLDPQVRMNGLENVYRRYAMHCLSSGNKMTQELKALDELQRILEINDERAEKINAEIASGMLQAAVAAASTDANLSEADRRTLDSLTQAFGADTGGTSASGTGTGTGSGSSDNVGGSQTGMSETAVLKMMQAIQQMMAVQDGDGNSQDDMELLKNLCDELGVDFEEVIRNAEKFGDQFGATGTGDMSSAFGKDFTDKLKSALPASEKEKGKTEKDN